MQNTSTQFPDIIDSPDYRYDSFSNGQVLHGKKKGHLPAMGWNSWNAFGSGNTEALTRAMAEKITELGLDRLGYKYLVLDDGCYLPERVEGRLSNDKEKFPSGFRALSDDLHAMGLKFGMYNDIGTNLCAGAYVGTAGHEKEDALSYIQWGVDFLKVDNCYYLWDNATFSDKTNAKYTYAPAIAGVTVSNEEGFLEEFTAGRNIAVTGNGAITEEIEGKVYIKGIGTFDGTGPEHTPVGEESCELEIQVAIPESGEYLVKLDCLMGEESGMGQWVQVAMGKGPSLNMLFDDMYPEQGIKVYLPAGSSTIRIMNHRRQENTLYSYAKLLEGLNEAAKDHDIIYSLCEWGKTQPQNWGKKVADSWRILNDIAFDVGKDGYPGSLTWEGDYTPNVCAQYNKAVIMDEFAGLDKGWNDPDMMVIGMNGLNMTQYRTHMAMWCMMNSPLMLGLDLRRVTKGDELYNIITNEELIKLNQDTLGIQAKRVYSSLLNKDFDTEYVTQNNRVDILAKPLSDGSVAVSFINLSGEVKNEGYSLDIDRIGKALMNKLPENLLKDFISAKAYSVKDLWTGECRIIKEKTISVNKLEAYDNVTVRVSVAEA